MFSPSFQAALPALCASYRIFAMEIACKSMLIFLISGILLIILRSASAAARALVWRLALFALLLLPCLSLCLPALRLAVHWRVAAAVTPPVAALTEPVASSRFPTDGVPSSEESPIPKFPEPTVARIPAPPPPTVPVPVVHPKTTVSQFLSALSAYPEMLAFFAWATGALLLLARTAIGIAGLRPLRQRALPASRGLDETARTLAQDYGLTRRVRILTASGALDSGSPLTWGWLRPCILLPSDIEEWPDERLRAVLLHELAHVARYDWPVLMLCDAVTALYWFDPLVWVLKRQLRRESEQACDDRALSFGIKASEYASHLLEIVRMKKSRRLPSLAAISMAQPSLLETRLRALLQPGRSRRPVSRAAALLAAGALVALLSPISAAHVVLRPIFAAASRNSDRTLRAAEQDIAAALHRKTGDEVPISGLPDASLPVALLPDNIRRAPTPATLNAVQTHPDSEDIAWGKSFHGLQAGLKRTEGIGPVSIGEHVTFQIWVRNSGKRQITVRFLKAPLDAERRNPFFWAAVTANEKKVSIAPQLANTGEQASDAFYLQAGEERVLPVPELRFQLQTMGNSAVTEPTIFVRPGKLTVQVLPFVVLAPEDAGLRTVGTGVLPMVVTDIASVSSVIAPRPEGDKIAKVDLNGIHWGAVRDGLQAGLRIAGAKHNFTARQRIAFECYIRNTSDHNIVFSYGAHYFLEQRPIVHAAADPGAEKKVTGVFLTGEEGAYSLNLGPGEMAAVYHPGLGLGKDQDPLPEAETGISAYPYLDDPADGAYIIEQTVLYHLVSKDEVGRPAQRFHAKDAAFIKPAKVKTVRPDGTVHIKDAAFVLLHAGSQPLTTGSARFTIGATKETEAALQPDHIAWGKALDGLQAGLRAPNNRREYHVGDTVRMDYIVRNVGTNDIAFDHEAFMDVVGTCPEVIDAAGKTANTYGEPYLHTPAMAHETLKPGAMLVLGQTGMRILAPGARRIGPDPKLGANEREAIIYMDAAPGAYRMRHLDTLSLQTGAGGKVVLYTGYLPLDILPEQQAITWGPVTNGLQAGAALQGGRTSFRLGEEIHTLLFVRNTSRHNIDIAWIENDDKFFVPELRDEAGRTVKPDWRNLTVQEKLQQKRTLKPGETECIAHPYFTIAKVTHQSLENFLGELSQATWFVGQPGPYRARLTAAITVNPSGDHNVAEQKGQINGASLNSGELRFAVTEK